MTYPRAVGRGVTALLLLVSLPGCAERAPSPSEDPWGIGWFGFTDLELAPAFPADVFEPSTA